MVACSKVSLSSCCTIVSLLTTIYCKKNLLFISKALIAGIAMSLAVILLLYFFIRTTVVGFPLWPMTYLVYGFQLCPELADQHKKGFHSYVLFFCALRVLLDVLVPTPFPFSLRVTIAVMKTA